MKKRYLLLLFSLLVCVTSYAQLLGGGGVVFGSEDEGKYGLNVKLMFPIKDRLHLSPSVTIFAPDNENKVSADTRIRVNVIDVDAQYHFSIVSELVAYPLAGLGLALSKTEVTTSNNTNTDNNSQIGLNLGGGIKYEIVDRIHLLGEVKFTIAGLEQSSLTLGILYMLFD